MERFFKGLFNLAGKFSEFVFPRSKSEAILSNISVSEFKNRVDKASNIEYETNEIQAIFSYRDPLVKDLIWLIKYKRRDFAIKLAAQFVLEEILEAVSEEIAFAGNRRTLLIPIPISKDRLKERGYNQMEDVAEEIMRIGGKDCFEYSNNILLKIKDSRSQTSIKNRKERLKNVVGCFKVREPNIVGGRNVLIIDDVSTTGATLREAKKILKEAGAKEVNLLSIAH